MSGKWTPLPQHFRVVDVVLVGLLRVGDWREFGSDD